LSSQYKEKIHAHLEGKLPALALKGRELVQFPPQSLSSPMCIPSEAQWDTSGRVVKPSEPGICLNGLKFPASLSAGIPFS